MRAKHTKKTVCVISALRWGALFLSLTGIPPVRCQVETPELALQIGHTLTYENSNVSQVTYSPDGHTVASAGGDPEVNAEIRLWDAATGELRRILRGHTGHYLQLAFSQSSDVLASLGGRVENSTIGLGGELKLWDVKAGRLLHSLYSPNMGDDALAFSPDGRRILVGGIDALSAWDVESGRQLWGIKEDAMAVAYSPDGKTVVTAEFSNEAKLRDATSGKILHALNPSKRDKDGRIQFLRYSPDGAFIAAASENGILRLWQVVDGELLREWQGHNADYFRGLAFLPDGKTLISGDWEGNLSFWSLSFRETANRGENTSQRKFRLPNAALSSFDLSPDGLAIVYTDGRQVVNREIASSQVRWKAPFGLLPMAGVAFTSDGSILATSNEDEGIRFWDLKNARLKRTMRDTGGTFQSDIVFSPNNKLLASSRFEKHLLWDAHTGKLLRSFPADQGTRPAFSLDGKFLAVDWGSNPGNVSIYDVVSGRRLSQREGFGPVSFFKDTETVISNGRWGATFTQIEFWNARTGKLQRVLRDAPPKNNGKLNPKAQGVILLDATSDGRTLACLIPSQEPDNDRLYKIQLWDAATGAQRRTLCSGRGLAVFSPDGKRLATLHNNKDVRVWDVASAELVATWTVREANLTNLCFAPSGKKLVCATQDGAITYWNISGRQLLATLQLLPPERDGVLSSDWLIYTPNGFYDGSPGAEKFIRWRVGTQLFPAQKFKARFNQPVKVRAALRG